MATRRDENPQPVEGTGPVDARAGETDGDWVIGHTVGDNPSPGLPDEATSADPKIRETPLEQCADNGWLDMRIARTLMAYGFTTLGSLADSPRVELGRIPHLGTASQEKVLALLGRVGLHMLDQSPAAAALSEQKRRLRMAGVRFAVVHGRTEDGREIGELVLVDQGNGRFRSPGAEEAREWCRRYPMQSLMVGCPIEEEAAGPGDSPRSPSQNDKP